MDDTTKNIIEKFPFLTVGEYCDQTYLGIVANMDGNLLSMYVLNLITDSDERKRFLDLGDEWWWESNRQLPISIFLGQRWAVFRPTLRTFSAKDFTVLGGPMVSLNTVMSKRIKRKNITLVRKE